MIVAYCAMSQELMQVALRVLSFYTGNIYEKPDPEDIAALQAAVEGEDRQLQPDQLAVLIIQQELNRGRAKPRRSPKSGQ